jgi:hypothetical protein
LTLVVVIKSIQGLPANFMPSSKFYSLENLKSFCPPGAIFIEGKMIKVDNIDAFEITSKAKVDLAVGTTFGYTLQYGIPFKGNIIDITYGSVSLNGQSALDNFQKFKTFFKTILSNTVVINQWE